MRKSSRRSASKRPSRLKKSPWPKRSARQWVVRGTLAGLAAAIGFYSISDTLANIVVKTDPEIAHGLAPWDGKATGKLAEHIMQISPSSASDSKPAELAQLALRQDATSVEALIVLAMQAQLRNQTEEARQIFAHSLYLSRRELQPQLWAIEEAVSRGDIDGALRRYDIALRTSRHAPDILYPALASALAEPRVRTRLITLMKADPVWGESFVNFAGSRGDNPEATATFFREGERFGLPIDDADRTVLVDALFGQGKPEEAWKYYTSFRSDAARSQVRDPEFAVDIERPSVFDWMAHSSPGVSAVIQRNADGGLVDFSAAPSTGGIVLDQRQVLPPGTYRFDSTVSGLDQPERSRPYWALTCEGGQEIGRITLPNAIDGAQSVSGQFTVPSSCPVQRLALVVRSSDEVAGVYGQIHSVDLKPMLGRDKGRVQK